MFRLLLHTNCFKVKASITILILIQAVAIGCVSAEEVTRDADSTKSIFQLLSDEDVLKISITTDIENLLAHKNIDTSQKGLLQIDGAQNHVKDWNIKVSARGRYRRKTCDFPPLKLKFKKKELRANGLKTYNDLKLVTHCSERAESEELVLKEYLAYKILNIITPQSFKVQLVKATWIDSGDHHNDEVKWAYLIESEEEVIERLGCKPYKEHGALHEQLDPENAAITYLFQYMIGNHDWKTESSQNICLIQQSTDDDIIAIPYDFDFSMLVGAYYTSIPYILNKTNKRMYLGKSSAAETKKAIELFQLKRKDIITEIKSCNHLSRSSRQDVISYIKSFYRHSQKPLNKPKTKY